MSINSTGIYDNTSELVQDVEQLKIDVDQLQLDFLNTDAGAVNSRVTILEKITLSSIIQTIN